MIANLSGEEFEKFQSLVSSRTGIHLNEKKAAMVQGRLLKRLIALRLSSYGDYYDYLHEHSEEMATLVEIISTHVTRFFREEGQWQFLEGYVKRLEPSKLRLWSAACSTGEEPYSLAMFLYDKLDDAAAWDIKILATDIARDSLRKAAKGLYRRENMTGVPAEYVERFFVEESGEPGTYRVCDEIREMILFREFNLVHGDFSLFSQPFDIIFCRNVMIYFNKQTRTELLTKLASLLRKRGVLLLGHSESIMGELPNMRFCASSVYEKI